MNNIRYLEVCSSNRNRNKFPYPSNFDILLGVPQTNNIVDPILTGVRWFTWQGGQGATGTSISAISSGTLASGSNDTKLILDQSQANPLQVLPYGIYTSSPNSVLSSEPLYYNGFRITIPENPGIYYSQSRIISSYEPDNGIIHVNPAFSTGYDLSGVNYSISDPSKLDFPPLGDLNPYGLLNQVHLPLFDDFGYPVLKYSQSYNQFYLIDETLSQAETIVSRNIIGYDSNLRIATVDSEIPGWMSSDIYSIVQYLPENKYRITDVNQYNNQITLPPFLTYGTGHFVGQYVYSTGLVALDQTVLGFTGQQINSTGPVDSAFLITEYSGAPNNILYVSPNSTNENNNNLPQINNSGVTGMNDIVSINTLVRDNFYPLIYSGTLVSQNESVAYEVSLIHLCLPNVILDTGSRIAQYPYVYVELTPIGSPSTVGKNVIYSNNPNANRALFTVAITDVVDPLTSAFVRISTSQVQTVKIKPNDNFHFSVFLSDGSLFLPFDENDLYYSPFPPNQFLQIYGLFGFKRL